MFKQKTSKLFSLIVLLTCLNFTSTAKDLEIEGATEVSKGQEVWYDINFDNATEMEWWVEGGYIIEIEGVQNNEYIYDYSLDEYGNNYGIYDFKTTNWTVVSDDKSYAQVMNYYGAVYGLTLNFGGGGGNNPFSSFNSTPSAGTKVDLPGGVFTIPPNASINTGGPKTDFCAGYCTGYLAANKKTKRVKIKWSSATAIGKIRVKGYDLGGTGLSGNKSTTQEVFICNHQGNDLPSISNTGTYKKCTEGLGLWVSNRKGQEYVWSSNGAHISAQWSSGANIEYFSQTGSVDIVLTNVGKCASYYTPKTITIQVDDVEPGVIINNITGNDVALEGVKLDCQGDADLKMPYYHNAAFYKWSYVSTRYDGEFNLLEGRNKNTFRGGAFFAEELADVQGKVTISGVCGTHEIPFTVPVTQRNPRLSQDITTCSNEATVRAFLPGGNQIYSWWVSSGNAQITNTTKSTAKVFFSGNDRNRTVEVCAAVECAGNLCATVEFGNEKAAGIQSGQLSDAQIPVTSELAYAPGKKIYFTSTDGDIYYYQFIDVLEKWVLNKTNLTVEGNKDESVLSPLAYSYADQVVFYWTNDGLRKRNSEINLAIRGLFTAPLKMVITNTPNAVLTHGILYTLESNGDLREVKKGDDVAVRLTNVSPISIATANNYGVLYFRNNNLILRDFEGGERVILSGVSPKNTTDLEVRGNYVYYMETSGLIRRVTIATGAFQVINNGTPGLSDFVVGKTSDEVYFNAPNEGYTAFQTSRLVGGVWQTSKTTNIITDNYFGSMIYTDPHIYYVSNNESGALFQQGVWNTFYVPGCESGANNVRKGSLSLDNEIDIEVYPNPVINSFQLTTSQEQNIQSVELVDVQGVVIKNYATGSSVYSTDDLTPGIYYAKVILDNGSTVVKAIIIQ